MDDKINAQHQFFERLRNAPSYAPDPMVGKLDLDDNVVLHDYMWNSSLFQKKLDDMHVDINTVLVKPDPAPIRILAIQETAPALLWRLYLITGDDTAQLLEDGIHLRRKGFPEKIFGGRPNLDDFNIHSEKGVPLWRPNPRGGWYVDQNGSGVVWHASITTIDDLRKHQNFGPLFRADCNALRQFVQPLRRGESTREMTLKIDVPVAPADRLREGNPLYHPCQVNLAQGQ